MVATIEAMCAECHNYHETDRVRGHYVIKNGDISLPFLCENQFFRIVGSKFNDGVYIYSYNALIIRSQTWQEVFDGNENWGTLIDKDIKWRDLVEHELVDEEFDGEVWPMNMPRAFLSLSKEISTYIESGADKVSGYTSESFGGYSYSKSSSESNAWENAFASKLKRWRKLVNIWP